MISMTSHFSQGRPGLIMDSYLVRIKLSVYQRKNEKERLINMKMIDLRINDYCCSGIGCGVAP